MKHFFAALLLLALPPSCSAQDLRLESIMQGDDFIGHSPENAAWSYDGKSVYFDWNPNSEPGNSPWRYDLVKGTTEQFTAGPELVPKAPFDHKASETHYFTDLGNLVRYNAKTGRQTVLSLQQWVNDVQRVTDPKHVYVLFQNNLFLFDETGGTLKQATNFQHGSAGGTKDSTELMKQQTELFGYIREEQAAKKWRDARQPDREFPKPAYFSGDEQLEQVTISPNERFVTFRLSVYPEETLTSLEEYITESGYTNRVPARAKVGDKDPSHRLGIYDRMRDTTYYVSFAGLTDIRKKPAYLAEYGNGEGLYEKDRAISIHAPVMHPDGMKAVIDLRSYDNKDRWIVLVDLEKGTVAEVEHQHDDAWIGGPGISEWNEDIATLDWLNGTTIYFQSEESGWSHLYTLDVDSGKKKALTGGKWEIYEVQLSKDKQVFYLLANKLHPGVRNGYKLDVKTSELIPLFEGSFGIEWALSPDEKHWAIRYSTPTQPWELYVADNKPGAVMKRVTHSTFPAYEQLAVKAPEIAQIPTSDGKEVTARLYRPEKPNGAAVLFVHGAGYLQNAHYYWSYYCREFLFNTMLAQQGYTVLDIDYRASEGYGRDVRTAIYRDMGNRDLQDYIDGKKYLVQHFGIDSNRVGIYGGSYGGFITLMGMLKTPGTFACGAALRSVTDWQHYNHEYTSNILNYPGTDPIAYRRSSPIYYADGLKGPLLMLHGMEDDNVQFQDIVRLNQRFIELGKTNYQLAIFPTEAHGFRSTASWIDEYRRIYELFETHLTN